MSNVVSSALKIEGDGHNWQVTFTTNETRTGPITYIAGDVYRLVNGKDELYFDSKHVVYMKKK